MKTFVRAVALAIAVLPALAAPALATFPEPARQPFRVLASKVEAEGIASVLDMALARMFPPAYREAHPDVVAERKAALLSAADPACFRTACLALAQLDLTPGLGAIRNPTLCLAGAEDLTTPAPLVRALAEGIPGARFQQIEGCGHCPQIENPAAFVAAVEAFLDA